MSQRQAERPGPRNRTMLYEEMTDQQRTELFDRLLEAVCQLVPLDVYGVGIVLATPHGSVYRSEFGFRQLNGEPRQTASEEPTSQQAATYLADGAERMAEELRREAGE